MTEKLFQKRITVGQLIELMSEEKFCYISKGGKSLYYEGFIKDIPDCLLDLEMLEISPKFKKREDDLGLIWDIGLYVYPNDNLDFLLLDNKSLPRLDKKTYDEIYNNFVNPFGIETSEEERSDKEEDGTEND